MVYQDRIDQLKIPIEYLVNKLKELQPIFENAETEYKNADTTWFRYLTNNWKADRKIDLAKAELR